MRQCVSCGGPQTRGQPVETAHRGARNTQHARDCFPRCLGAAVHSRSCAEQDVEWSRHPPRPVHGAHRCGRHTRRCPRLPGAWGRRGWVEGQRAAHARRLAQSPPILAVGREGRWPRFELPLLVSHMTWPWNDSLSLAPWVQEVLWGEDRPLLRLAGRVHADAHPRLRGRGHRVPLRVCHGRREHPQVGGQPPPWAYSFPSCQHRFAVHMHSALGNRLPDGGAGSRGFRGCLK